MGAKARFRGADDPAFGPEEIDFLASLPVQFARGLRTGVLARLADTPAPTQAPGPTGWFAG